MNKTLRRATLAAVYIGASGVAILASGALIVWGIARRDGEV